MAKMNAIIARRAGNAIVDMRLEYELCRRNSSLNMALRSQSRLIPPRRRALRGSLYPGRRPDGPLSA